MTSDERSIGVLVPVGPVLMAVILIITAAAIAFGWWRLSLWLWPYTSTCWFCKGRGSMKGSKTKRHGPCKFCHGQKRLRRGAREPR